MKVLVFEQWQGGHYFNYLECLVPRLAQIADEVVVAVTRKAAASELFARQLGHLAHLPQVRIDASVPIPEDKSGAAFRWRLARNVVDAMQRHRPDHAFLPSADEQILALPGHALLGHGGGTLKAPIEAVLHYKAYTARADLRERLTSGLQGALLRTGVFSKLNFVNCLQWEDAVRLGLRCAAIGRPAGDPVPQPPRIAREPARQLLGLDPAARYIGTIGAMDARKAVPATLAAFRAAALGPHDHLLLAGKLIPEYAALLRDGYQDLVHAGRIVVIDRFLSDDEVASGFAALDVNCSVYTNFSGLSSLMLKSLAAGVPVIAGRHGWSGAIVKRFGVGATVDPGDVDGFAQTMRDALDASAGYVESEPIRRLMQFHSVGSFVEGLVERAATRAGRPPLQPVRSWAWVLDALPPERRALR